MHGVFVQGQLLPSVYISLRVFYNYFDFLKVEVPGVRTVDRVVY